MRGTVAAGMLAVVGSLWWLIVNWRLWRDPGRLHPGHWRYQAIHRRMRGGVQRPKGDDLAIDEIRIYAVGSMIVGVVGIVIGVLLVMGLVE